MKSNLAIAAACLAAILLSVATLFSLYREVHPLGGIRLLIDADSAGRQAASVAEEVSPDLKLPKRDAQLSKNDELIRGVLAKLGHQQGVEALRKEVPGYFWNIQWRRYESGKVEIVTGDERRPEDRNSAGIPAGEIRIRLSASGRLLEFEWSLHDTASVPAASPDTSRKQAEEFLRRHFAYVNNWDFTGEKKTEQVHRTDMEYTWHGSLASIGEPVDVKIKAAGSRILAAGISYPAFSGVPEPEAVKAHGIVMAFLLVGFVILIIVVAFRRSRAYEMSFRLGSILGLFLALLLALQIYVNLNGETGWEALVPAVIGPLFFGGGFILLWSVAESVAREAWRGKFSSFDLLINGHVVHSRVGRSLLQGMAVGAVASAVWALLVLSVRTVVPNLYVPADNDVLMELGRWTAPFVLAGQSLTNTAYIFTALLLFLVSLLRFRIHSSLLLVAVSGIVVGVTNKGGATPLAAGIGITAVVAAVLSWGFYKFDVLASFFSFVVLSLLMVLPAFFFAGTATCAQAGWVMAGGMVFVAMIALTGIVTHDRTVDLEAITPAFVKHITERERLQRELEIARDVQMSFLPRRDPEIVGVDIASRCVPALEVGGDYYDFVRLGEDRFGVVVGDVSGKGTQAAFYMTLTKGFLKAVTRASQSPAEVLTQLNDLFYENVERGTFISMVYGIFDLRNRKAVIARAGHNPPVHKSAASGRVEFVQPAGLALGLEAGPAFAATIREFATEICPGDLFVFYTDGFTEAMNRQKEEYGEERFRVSAQNHASGTAAEVLEGIFADVREHAGKSKQHDDMTIVVVKT